MIQIFKNISSYFGKCIKKNFSYDFKFHVFYSIDGLMGRSVLASSDFVVKDVMIKY